MYFEAKQSLINDAVNTKKQLSRQSASVLLTKVKLNVTFNTEMFLFVMKFCHTVVIKEKIDTAKIKFIAVEFSVPTSLLKKLLSGFW